MSFTLRRVDLHRPVAAWYSKYLESDRWRTFRAKIIAERGEFCEICKIDKAYSLHHNTYARLFNELPEDVTLVCKDCHKEIHTFYKIPCMGLIYMEFLYEVKAMLNMAALQRSTAKPYRRTLSRSN